MGLFNWPKSPSAIKKEEREEKIKKLEIVLADYANELFSKPLELKMSPAGFPLCPGCGGEFKDLEEIIKHLNRKKTEWLELGYNNTLYEKGTKIEIVIYDDIKLWRCSFLDEHTWISERFEDFDNVYNQIEAKIKEGIEYEIRKIKLFREIEERKHTDWKEVKKAKPRENPLSPKVRFEVLKRDHFTCQYCGRKSPEVELEVDHIEPYSKTKDNSMENLITACKDCNRGKKADTFMIQD